jgi:hypothetical protein
MMMILLICNSQSSLEGPKFVETGSLLILFGSRSASVPRQAFQRFGANSQSVLENVANFSADSRKSRFAVETYVRNLSDNVLVFDLKVPAADRAVFPMADRWHIIFHSDGREQGAYHSLYFRTLPWHRSQFRRWQLLHVINKEQTMVANPHYAAR